MYDVRDERGVPISAGIPPIVRVAFGIGTLLIFIIGGLVVFASRYGHVWPSINSTRIHL
jgi:hypothetical protein